MHPNVLVIVLDAARADHFEPYGAREGSTPAVSDLASAGRHVTGYAAGSWTIPSHAALFSGLLPRAAGLSRAPDRTPQSCRPRLEGLRDRLLPEVFRRNGYETRAISTNAWLTPGSGFETGFERFELIDPSRHLSFGASGRRSGIRAAWEAARARVDDGAAEAGAVLRRWVNEPRDKPFFWFVNLVEAHSPYLPPKPFNDLGLIGRVQAAGEARKYLSMDAVWKASLGHLQVPDAALARMRRLYAGAIRSLDNWIGEVLDTLDAAKSLDDTLVIVTADHGENLGEDRMMGHAFSLDERLLKVPLVAAGPVQPLAEPLTSLASVPHRVAEAVGLPNHPWEPWPTPGIGVAQFDPPTGAGDPRNDLLLQRWGLEDATGAITASFTTSMTCASDGAFKLVRRGEDEELFDLRSDPAEASPLPPRAVNPDVTRRLRDAMESSSSAIEDGTPARGETAESADAPDDLEDRMRMLGYM